MNDFLNPKSMMTPGAAGALVMFLSNAVCFQFPDIEPRWVAISLSFVLGGFVIASAKLRVLPRAGFWVVNSLIIFAVAAGSANFAAKAGSQAASGAAAALALLVTSANAQEPKVTPPNATNDSVSLKAQLDAAQARIVQQQAQLENLQKAYAQAAQVAPRKPSSATQKDRFFEEW